MENSISTLSKSFTPIRNSISPMVNKLHVHLDVFPDKLKEDLKLADSGFINFNLCLNAQTELVHTKCDASYTVISVPNQISKSTPVDKKNKG